MRYRINRENFFAREEEQGTMAIMVRKTNQILHFNRAGRHIFDLCDQWVELDDFLRNLGAVKATPAKLRRFFEELLYKLHVCGLAELEDLPQPCGTGCRWATAADTMRLSAFLTAYAAKGLSCAAMLSASYNGRYGVYTRLYEKRAQYLISERKGQILALLEITRPEHIPGNAVLNISTAVFHDSLDDAAAREQLRLMTDYAAQRCAGQASKLRYAVMHPRQAWMREAVAECGFVQTAHFPQELQNGSDLVYFDRMV